MPNVFSRGIAVDPSSFRRQLKVDYMEDVINDNPLTRKLYAKVQDMSISDSEALLHMSYIALILEGA
jgi:hypothetical protein